MIRDSKTTYYNKLADKLKSNTISAKDWWSTLKTFINPHSSSSMPPLEYDNNIYTDESDKANILNIFFPKSNFTKRDKCCSSRFDPSCSKYRTEHYCPYSDRSGISS